MKKIIITADSGISPIVEDKRLIIPAFINSNNGNEYLDGKITNREILDKLGQGEILKTSSPAFCTYEETFRDLLDEYEEIIHLSMSSGISSGSVEMSNLVSRVVDPDRISVIDTYQGATGGTLIYALADNLKEKGLNKKDIVEVLEELKTRIATSFLVPNPEGFIRSGRDKSELHFEDKLKKIYADMRVKRGYKFRVDFDFKGNLKNAGSFKAREDYFYPILDSMLNDDNIENYDPNYIVIGSVYEDQVKMGRIQAYIEKKCYFKNIIVKEFPGVVAAYGCNDLCGVSVVQKKKVKQ